MKLNSFCFILFFLLSPCIYAKDSPEIWALRQKQILLNERNNPHIRAFLDLIGRAECGEHYYSPHKGYLSRYPSTVFNSFESHPGGVLCAISGDKQLCSSAAGRYMFLESVWNSIAQRLYLTDFSPLNQDIAALYLIKERNALEDIKKGDVRNAVLKLNKVWSSLPGSPYKQPVKRMKDIELFFDMRLDYFKQYLKAGV